MNELGANILKIMESSSLGSMSVFVLTKQSQELSINLEAISEDEAKKLTARLDTVLPFFLADETGEVIRNIRKVVGIDNMVIA